MAFLLAIVFIASGILKLIGLESASDEITLYSELYLNLSLSHWGKMLTVALCLFEIAIGLAAFHYKTRGIACIAMSALLAFFTWITGRNLFFPTIFGSIESCGCFGELIHFSPRTSFIKSLVLLLLSLPPAWKACRILLKQTSILFPFFFVGIIFSCTNSTDKSLEWALASAEENREELEKVLEHYASHPEKKKAAEFLIANMPLHYGYYGAELDSVEEVLRPLMGYDGMILVDSKAKEKWGKFPFYALPRKWDVKTLHADYIIDNIDRAYDQYKKRLWNADLAFEDFCEYILPYRICDEPLTSWRAAYEKKFAQRLDSLYHGDDVLEACRIVKKLVDDDLPNKYNAEISTPHRSALALLNNHVGQCRDDCDRYIYAMRACGIPVTADMTIVSPEHDGGHEWMTVRDNKTGLFIPFGYDGMTLTREETIWDRRTKGKVYRYKYGENIARNDREEAPMSHDIAVLCHPRLYDVTDNYFGSNKINIPCNAKRNEKICLGVCPKGHFLPIDMGKWTWGGKVQFQNVEPNVLFFPIVRHEGKDWEACGDAFRVTKDGKIQYFQPDTTKLLSLHLTTKMPHNWRQKEWLEEYMVGITIEASKNSSFTPCDTIAHIYEPTGNNYFEIENKKLKSDNYYQYLRISPPTGIYPYLLLGELELYADMKCKELIPYNVLGKLPDRCNISNINDGNVLTFIETPKGYGPLTLKMNQAKRIARTVIIPRTTDNFVWPGQDYELYYLDGANGWKSAGRKTAKDHFIDFQAPSNAVYILRNHTKGTEEQVFIYSHGTQLFSLDLHE